MPTELPIYQVDAFASAPFTGNPAAVCPLTEWLPTETMQAIAAENNLSETAFFVPQGDDYGLKWFTPKAEVQLCGHATLATAHVLFSQLGYQGERLTFHTLSGPLRVTRQADGYAMDFPARKPTPVKLDRSSLLQALPGGEPLSVFDSVYRFVEYASQAEIAAITPKLAEIEQICDFAICITAPGDSPGLDFVSRFFAPSKGIAEDPVTGSAHCSLAPFWAKKLGKNRLNARQLSERGGSVQCTLQGDRVLLGGQAVTVLKGAFIL